MIHINTAIEKTDRENKYCVILGDFDLDLLKFESHPGTNDFLNTLVSSYFQPQILQPTRITDHPATRIDNIFFNSLEHFTISGNLIYDLTDHLPNFLIVRKLSSLPESIKIFRRDYSRLDEQALIKTGIHCSAVILIQVVCLILFTVKYQNLLIYTFRSSNCQRKSQNSKPSHGLHLQY